MTDRAGYLTEDKALAEFLGVEEVDDRSGNDTANQGEEKSEPSTSVCDRVSRLALNPFPDRGAATALKARGAMSNMDPSIISNPLDEEQQRILDQAESARG
uniref:Uncharacterized protein n=1 Tax=Peronospora matthiolae TaxID=2874970 RepID=A0AAV1TJN0_9STRA